jgi:signal peptidase I
MSFHTHLSDPSRGDVIIFKYPKDPSKYFIKRVIGLPGETVDINGTDVKIFNTENPDGVTITEPYVDFNKSGNVHLTLRDDEYFVMGDNRFASSDSRVWGPLERNMIIGKAFLRLFPIEKADVNPGDYNIEVK